MFLAQISDTHLVTEGPAAEPRIAALRRTVRFLAALDPQPAAVIHTGDISHNGTPDQYALAKALMAPLRAPLRVVPGNRDQRETLRGVFAEEAPADPGSPFLQYAFRIGEIDLVAADTLHETRSLGDFCAGRMEQMESLLSASTGRPTVVVLHHPPVAVPDMTDPMQYVDPAVGYRLADLIASHPHVIGVLAGHTHRSDCLPLGSTYVTTMPSLAVDLRNRPTPDATAGAPIVHLHEVTPAGLVTRSIVVP